ncbi:MAG: RluA family pseudouridine synthase [Clostridia bacterium]|nr:RluA family pseudouridine synthase [Clostridia bacterium]
MIINVDTPREGKTVKEILFSELGLSRGQVVSLKNNDGIRVNGAHVTVRYILKAGDILELDVEDREEDMNCHITPVSIPLDILYEDDNVVCVNKPSGMPTHPSHNHHGDTLANALAYYYEEKGIPFVFRAVNRLDRETSGVVLIAKNRAAAAKLGNALQRNQFEKSYYAVVCGAPRENKGVITAYISRKEGSIIFRKASETGSPSEYAETHYEIKQTYDAYTLVELKPVTGRTHQLRVHMSYIGNPIYGDGLYGEESDSPLMLHAASLTFPLPEGNRITVTAPIPTRFEIFRRKNEDKELS